MNVIVCGCQRFRDSVAGVSSATALVRLRVLDLKGTPSRRLSAINEIGGGLNTAPFFSAPGDPRVLREAVHIGARCLLTRIGRV